MNKTINELKLALDMPFETFAQKGRFRDEIICILIEALEQPLTRDWKDTIDERIARDSEFKEALEKPAQEPVAWMDENNYVFEKASDIDSGGIKIPLYTHPHQWQGLTDDEIVKELERTDEYMGKSFFAGVRWAEQALKDKNT